MLKRKREKRRFCLSLNIDLSNFCLLTLATQTASSNQNLCESLQIGKGLSFVTSFIETISWCSSVIHPGDVSFSKEEIDAVIENLCGDSMQRDTKFIEARHAHVFNDDASAQNDFIEAPLSRDSKILNTLLAPSFVVPKECSSSRPLACQVGRKC